MDEDLITITTYQDFIRYYFNQMITRPIIFVNTSNHAMAEIDTRLDYQILE